MNSNIQIIHKEFQEILNELHSDNLKNIKKKDFNEEKDDDEEQSEPASHIPDIYGPNFQLPIFDQLVDEEEVDEVIKKHCSKSRTEKIDADENLSKHHQQKKELLKKFQNFPLACEYLKNPMKNSKTNKNFSKDDLKLICDELNIKYKTSDVKTT